MIGRSQPQKEPGEGGAQLGRDRMQGLRTRQDLHSHLKIAIVMRISSSNTNDSKNDGQWRIMANVLCALHKSPHLLLMQPLKWVLLESLF